MTSVFPEESERQISRARGKASEAAAAVQDAARETIDKYSDAAKHTAEDVADRARTAGHEISGNVQEVAGNFREAIERSVERQPITTVLLAVAAGVLLGGLLRR
jgi:ElaB/YqjD/DUF883 family membrane-anchored ribosome-binding protein